MITPRTSTPRDSWMEQHLGRAALPVAAIGGSLAGYAVGRLAFGSGGDLLGSFAGALLGAALVKIV